MSENLITIKNMNLSFRLQYHRTDSLREIFINFTKSPFKSVFGDRDVLHVLQNINLTVNKGERIGIIGVNGSGKTSLCRVICEMYRPDSGKILINGEIRAIFDTSIGIQPELTGRENAQLIGRLMFSKMKKAQLVSLVEEALEFSELDNFVDIPYKYYSKGMQARLCLSLISAKACDVLILDEVFDGADTFFQKKISNRVLKMIKNSGAVIFVSHSPDQIRSACNRVIVLNDHRIHFDGGVEQGLEIYENLHK